MSVVQRLENITLNKSVLILGFGREGRSTLKAIMSYCHPKSIGVADREPKHIELSKAVEGYFGDGYLEAISDYDIIFCSPGISIQKLNSYLIRKQHITSQADLILDVFSKKTIGVTGTKGKSTTSTLIHSLLHKAKKKVCLVGNIGKPAFDYLDEIDLADFVIYELSSHQLTTVKNSPHIGVLLNLFPEHLDYYSSLEIYYEAKSRVFHYQSHLDYLILNGDDKELQKIASYAKAKKVWFSSSPLGKCSAWFDDSKIFFHVNGGKKVINRSLCKLPGDINVYNIMASILAASLVTRLSEQTCAKVLESFSGLPNRMENIGVFNGVQFINDSISTTPDTACAALLTFGGDVNTLILGGQDRPVEPERYYKLACLIEKNKVNNLIFIHQNGRKIMRIVHSTLENLDFSVCSYLADDMTDVVQRAYQVTRAGNICLFSPAAPSFGVYKDYAERGEKFRESIYALNESKIIA